MMKLNTTIQTLRASIGASIPHKDLDIIVSLYLNSIDKKLSNEGKARACSYFKQLHLIAITIVTKGETLPVIPFCKTDKDGYPKELIPLKPLLTGNADLQRIGLTITRFYEKIVLPVQWNPAPITEPGPEINIITEEKLKSFAESWCKSLGIRNVRIPARDKIIGRMVKGPNGPAIMTSHYDAVAVVKDKVLHKNLSKLATLTGNKWMIDLMEDLANEHADNNYISGRISLLQEGGGKTRTIAVGDYWSQNILQSIHDKLMYILRKMETDGTYNQGNQVDRISTLSLGHKTYSFDLTSATDRFPVRVQEILLSQVFSQEIAKSWKDVLTQRQFQYKNTMVKWKVGQPLGLLSSWAAFSLTHHFIIEYCAFNVGIKSFRDYAVLGDDVVIWNEKVALLYKDLLMEMGIPINMNKSLVSDDRTHRVEFAKRIIVNGTEVTGIKWNVLNQAHNLYGYVDLIRVCQMRHWNLPWADLVVPSNLSEDRKELLSVLLWDASGGLHAPLQGNMMSPTDDLYKQLKDKVRELRIQSLREKRDSVDKILSSAKPIEDLFNREGVTVSARSIGLKGHNNSLHPIVWALNQVGEDLFIGLSMLETVPDNETPDILPVEFLPIPMVATYFGDQHLLKSKTRTTFVLKAWTQIKNLCQTSGM